jgi:hypothetical protein
MEDEMYKRVLIGLFVISVVAMWGSAAQAFNRINGIIIRHGSLEVEVTLCGDPLEDTLLTVELEVKVEILCKNPAGKIVPGNPGRQTFNLTFSADETVLSPDDFNTPTCDSGEPSNNLTAQKIFTFNLSEDTQCKQKNFTKVPGSELAKKVSATVAWCNDAACQQPIEILESQCTGSRGEGGVPDEDIDCETVHAGGVEGEPPPPIEEECEYCCEGYYCSD